MIENPTVQKEVDVILNGNEFQLRMAANNRLLQLELESKYDAQFWRNTYTLDYIQELTQKTGNQKPFSVFVNILSTALGQNNESAFFEILTFKDLENMKQQRMSESRQSQHSQQSQQSQQSQAQNKRYLILSYQTQFESIHYPLTLNYEEQVDSSKLISKINNLKSELLDYKTKEEFQFTDNSFKRDIHTADSQWKNENDLLKAKVRRLEEQLQQKKGALEVDQLIRDNEQLEQELNQLKIDSEEKTKKLESQLAQKNKELIMSMAEINAFKQELTNLIGKNEVNMRIKAHIENMNYEEDQKIQKQQKLISKQDKEIESLNQQIDFLKKQDTIQKKRITQLENEIQQSQKRFNHRGVTDRLYSPYSNQSNGSRKSNNSMPNKMNSKPISANASPNLSRSSRNSTQNSTNKRMYTSNSQQRQNAALKPTPPQRQVKSSIPSQQQLQQQSQRRSPAQRNPFQYSPGRNPIAQRKPIEPQRINKSPVNNRVMTNTQQRNNVQQRNNPQQKQRVNYSAQNYNQKIAQDKRHQKQKNIVDLDNKINNLKYMLQKAKR